MDMNDKKSARGACFNWREPYVSYRFYDYIDAPHIKTGYYTGLGYYTGFRFILKKK